MKRLRLLLLSFAIVMYIVTVSANNQTYSMSSLQEGQGIDLNEYAFAIPLKNAGEYEHTVNVPNGIYVVAYYLNGNINSKKIQVK